MEDLEENISSTPFESLFIKEEDVDDKIVTEQRECNATQSGLTFTGTQLSQSALIKPYLQEMDDLLKSCEELTGIPFGTHFSASYNEMSLTGSTYSHSNEEGTMISCEKTSISPQAYLSTSYIDTHMDGAGTEDQPAQDQSQGLDNIINRCGVTADVPCQRGMPLTSVGSKLCDSMVEYESQLLGMLAMLDSCMEDPGMDFEPQDCATDAGQEYVHISKNHHFCRGTTLVPIQQGRSMKFENQLMQVESWPGPHAEGAEAARGSINEIGAGSATNGSQKSPTLSSDNMGGLLMEKQGDLETDVGVREPQFSESMDCEEAKIGHMVTHEGTSMKGNVMGIQVANIELPAEERQGVDTFVQGSVMNDIGALGSKMEECIDEVQRLEMRRKELLAEVQQLRGNNDGEEAKGTNDEETGESIDRKVAELMDVLRREEEGRREERKREIQSLREERAEEEMRMWKVNLERQGLQEELRKLKRRLFAAARDCAHNQVALNTQHRGVELLKREEEKLQSLVLQLTEEDAQLRSAQQQQLLDLQAKIHAQSSAQTTSTQDELSECKRHSCGDIQQYLQGGLRSLEDRYEPILLALLKRRELTSGALVKAKENAQELRAQLRPLKEEIQKLNLQRACLEEKLKMIHIQRREDVGQYKETVYCLEESSRELKTELKIQMRKNKQIEELRESLTKQLLLIRATIENHKCDSKEET